MLLGVQILPVVDAIDCCFKLKSRYAIKKFMPKVKNRQKWQMLVLKIRFCIIVKNPAQKIVQSHHCGFAIHATEK